MNKEKYGLDYRKIPHEDLIWISTQTPSVVKLFLQCWICAPENDGHWRVLNHSLKTTAFRRASKALREKGLFVISCSKSIRDARETAYWEVANLEGADKSKFEVELIDKYIGNIIRYQNTSVPFSDVCEGSTYWNKELLRWEGKYSHELNEGLVHYP